ncbi:hypothetical protein BJ944DRAFT_232510 [Cunninghamella echinulata]|nr:hypothetical protein BJ944DRAFT_232510 [Cunninghamella echinulata]
MAPLLHHHHQQPFMKHISSSFSSSSRSTKTKTIRIPPFPLVLIGLGLTCLGIGLYDHFLSDIQKYPTTVRTPLRKALYYERTDPQLALPYFEQAFQEALVEPTLEMNGAPLTGILIQWGTLLERLQRKNEARQVLILALRHLLGMEERLNDNIKMSDHNNEDQNKNEIDHQKGSVKKQLSDQDIFTFIDWTTLPPLEQKKVIGLCLKIGDLDVILHRDDEAEQYYVAAVEHLLKSSSKPTSQYGDHGDAVVFDKEHLPQWLTENDVGVALATLGQFYASKNKYRYAIELYLRALNLNGMNNCQASVFMNNLAESYVSLNQFNEAKHWAEKGINLAQNPNTYKVNNDKQVCDETCGVLLFNLGMIFEQMKEKEKAIQMYQQSIQHSRQHEQFMSVQEALKARKRVEFELARENQAKVA